MSSGANGEMNGSDVLVEIETPPGSGTFETLSSQRGATFAEKDATIDFSSKNSRAARVGPGRYSWTCSISHLYIPTQSGLAAIKTAIRTGQLIGVRRSENGSAVESGYGVISGRSSDFPDQGPAVVSVDITGDGVFNPVP